MIPVPERMAHLDRDHRGYPIPFIVFRDKGGKPHFTINDHRKLALCRADDVCAICGRSLFRGRWFVGGPMSALAPTGAYIDPPLHRECMHFAVQTCPYIISAKYTKRIDGKTLAPDPYGETLMLTDPTMIPGRPKMFVAVMAIGQKYTSNGYVVPNRPYRQMEFWRDGKLLRSIEGPAIAAAFRRVEGARLMTQEQFDAEN